MTLKEFSNIFGVGISELSKITGYSRQSLYNIFEGKVISSKNRFYSCINHLSLISDKIYENDISEAKKRENARQKALKEFERIAKGE